MPVSLGTADFSGQFRQIVAIFLTLLAVLLHESQSKATFLGVGTTIDCERLVRTHMELADMQPAFRLSRVNQPRATGWAMLLLIGVFVALGLAADQVASAGAAQARPALSPDLAFPACCIFWERQ